MNISEIESKCFNKEVLTHEEIIDFLDYVIYEVRDKLSLFKGKNTYNYDFSFMCDTAQAMIVRYFEKMNINCKGVSTLKAIDENVLGHNFVIASFLTDDGNEDYIIDPTYIQFFDEDKCSKDNFKVINRILVKTPYPGYFVKDNQDILAFLKKGYMFLNDKNAKMYGDSFYKTKTGVVNVLNSDLSMPGQIYIKGFKKSDCEITYTEEELKKLNLALGSNLKEFLK